MPSRAYFLDPTPTGPALSQLASAQSKAPWAVVLAGGDGTRLQRLTLQISGDTRPKQFCKLMGGDSLLGQTCRRIEPLFTRDRQLYVLTRAHEAFYRDEPSISSTASFLEQPCNRGTAVAIGVAALRLLEAETDPLVVFFPSDHHYSNERAFVRAVNAALEYARTNPTKIVLLAAEPHYPEVEYGWIEPGAVVSDVPTAQLSRVTRFWEKPSLPQAQVLLQRRCLWNTFVTIGRAATFLELLCSRIPEVVASIGTAVTNGGFDATFQRLPSVDISREVFSPQPGRLLAFRDTESGWADLGTPKRVFDTLARSDKKPEWLSHLSPRHGDLKLGSVCLT
jgi:mannose-1-phosphate guanylyltransferase